MGTFSGENLPKFSEYFKPWQPVKSSYQPDVPMEGLGIEGEFSR